MPVPTSGPTKLTSHPHQVLLCGADSAHTPGPPPWARATARAAVHPGPPTRGDHTLPLLLAQGTRWDTQGKGQRQDKMTSVAKRQGSTHKDPPWEGPPTEGGSLSLCPDTMPLPLIFPGSFIEFTLAFRVQSKVHGWSWALASCPLAAVTSCWRPTRAPASQQPWGCTREVLMGIEAPAPGLTGAGVSH